MKNLFYNKALKVLLITNGLVILAGAMLGPIYALFVEEIGGDLLDASLVGATFAFAAGITTLIAGKYADKIKREELIVVAGYIIIGLGFLLLTQVKSIYSLLIIQAIIGFGEAIYSPAFDALYTRHETKKKAGREWGTWEAMASFSIGIGAITGGLIATKYGFDTIFIIMAILCFASAAYLATIKKSVL